MRFRVLALVLTGSLLFSVALAGRSQAAQADQPAIQEIIEKFAAAESRNRDARINYTFTQDVEMLTLGEAGSITGRYRRVSDIVYDDLGNRVERITHFPLSTLKVTLTQQDLQDLAGVQPFALTTEDLPKYNLKYVSKEKIDELNTYVFDVAPRQIRKGERYLEGRIYVDDQDLQIVKVAGKAVPEMDKQKFPRFESYRENIDGRYWFPTYIYADDILDFKNNPVRLRLIVRYTNYKKFSTNIRVGEDYEEEPGAAGKTEPKNKTPEEKKKRP